MCEEKKQGKTGLYLRKTELIQGKTGLIQGKTELIQGKTGLYLRKTGPIQGKTELISLFFGRSGGWLRVRKAPPSVVQAGND